MKHEVVPVKNVMRLVQGVRLIANRGQGVPGMMVVDGMTGQGKTLASSWAIVRDRGIFVRSLSVSTRQSFLSAICRELDILPLATAAKMVDAIVAKLAADPRILWIDEADKLVAMKQLIEITRDLHDLLHNVPGTGVILIGEGSLRQKVEQIPRLAGRILETVDFLPLEMDDARLMTDRLCEVKVADDLVRALNEAGKGSARRLVVGLHKIERTAKAAGITKISAEEWPKGEDFFLGDVRSRSRGR